MHRLAVRRRFEQRLHHVVVRVGLVGEAAAVGAHLRTELERELEGVKGVVEYRGQGLMIGIELDRPCSDLLKQACAAGLLISVTAERVVRLLPPLIMSKAEADQVVAILAPLIRKFLTS